MIWLTWRQHRQQALAGAIGLALIALFMFLPIMFILFGGRQTNINMGGDDTMQERVQLWSEGLDLFREAPVFGIGYREYAEQVGQVAHNSFVHCYAELGFFGGTIFLAAFAFRFTRSGSFAPPVSRFHSSNVLFEIFPLIRSSANFRRCA